MAISLKNISDRVAALEKKIASSGGIVESKLSNPGYAKFSNGLIVNFGYTEVSSGYSSRTVTFPKSFAKMASFMVSMRSGGSGDAQHNSFYVNRVTLIDANFRNSAREGSSMSWIAIGYLISNRILKYISKFLNSFKNLKAVI